MAASVHIFDCFLEYLASQTREGPKTIEGYPNGEYGGADVPSVLHNVSVAVLGPDWTPDLSLVDVTDLDHVLAGYDLFLNNWNQDYNGIWSATFTSTNGMTSHAEWIQFDVSLQAGAPTGFFRYLVVYSEAWGGLIAYIDLGESASMTTYDILDIETFEMEFLAG